MASSPWAEQSFAKAEPIRPRGASTHASANAQAMSERITDLEERVAYLESELALALDTDRIARLRASLGIQQQAARMLLALMAAKGRFVSSAYLAELLPRPDGGEGMKIIRVYAGDLRKVLGPQAIENARNIGYRLTEHGRARVQALLN